MPHAISRRITALVNRLIWNLLYLETLVCFLDFSGWHREYSAFSKDAVPSEGKLVSINVT